MKIAWNSDFVYGGLVVVGGLYHLFSSFTGIPSVLLAIELYEVFVQ